MKWNKIDTICGNKNIIRLMLMLWCCVEIVSGGGSGGTNQFILIQINIDTLPSNPIIHTARPRYLCIQNNISLLDHSMGDFCAMDVTILSVRNFSSVRCMYLLRANVNIGYM